jgi:hypothetical protein
VTEPEKIISDVGSLLGGSGGELIIWRRKQMRILDDLYSSVKLALQRVPKNVGYVRKCSYVIAHGINNDGIFRVPRMILPDIPAKGEEIHQEMRKVDQRAGSTRFLRGRE